MKITDIEPQRKKDRVNIYIDHKFAFGLSLELKYIYDLKIDKDIDDDFIENVLKEEEARKAINTALNFLSYRQRSEREIRNKLKEKGYEKDYIERAIYFCKNQNYIDDESFAVNFVKDKINLNKFGTQRLKRELILKGIDGDIIESVLVEEDDDEYERALQIATKKYSTYKDDDKNKIYRKLGGFLQRKGYSFDIVNKILKELLD
ncbi:regulatory protein RecX [Tissierella creatinophila]|uniref:Regulatory protein RecX n=1 Tax=Tissierella creatinophila DSM 6911 TaxID=1123403 RepID=A0A1U7M5S2_TISCR|nr:regulatory protein RecX [Tissierella creatinophila]OLS02538.1 regulatory protein RecX [Tissierella creatinophila DSM 6911]